MDLNLIRMIEKMRQVTLTEIAFHIFLRLLAQTQPDRFQPDWNHLDWNDPDDTDTDDPKDDPGGPGSKPRSLSTPNIPVHILSAPIDCPKITSSQTLRKLQFKDVNF